MLTPDDIIDVLMAGLDKAGPVPRIFLSEHEIKKRLTAGGGRLTIPPGAIISPLAADWLALKGIEVVEE